MTATEIAQSRIRELSDLLPNFEFECVPTLLAASEVLINVFQKGSKVLICGNGGSAADSQHFAAELVSAFSRDIERPALSAIALTVDTSIITAFSNDFGYERVFARQVEAHGRSGDLLIAITTSGSSINCIEAVATAKRMGMRTIALSRKGGKICRETDLAIEVPSNNTQHIQECHVMSYHIMSELIEKGLYGGAKS